MSSTRTCVPGLLLASLLGCGAPAPPEAPSSPPPVATPATSGPTVRDVESALASGDIDKARTLADALVARDGDGPAIREARDAVSAAETARSERTERLRQVQTLIDAQKPAEAIAALDRWFGDPSKSDAQIAEARARAHDVAFVLCSDAICRYVEAHKASAWASTAERTARGAEARAGLISALAFAEVPAEGTLARLRRLRAFIEAATNMSQALAGDSDLHARAASAKSWAEAERAKVPLLGSEVATAEELLGPFAEQSAKVALASLGTVLAYLSFDSRRKCIGVYIVGSSGTSRVLNLGDDALHRVASQAVGRHATIRESASTNTTTSSWTEGPFPVVARWKYGALMELRISDATP